jgi:WD40 repeat protein/signal transduction histidine kinase
VTSTEIPYDTKYLASALADNSINVWDITERKILSFVRAHSKLITSVAGMPHSNQIVTASSDHTIAIWNIENQIILNQRIEGAHHDSLTTVVVTPNNKYIVSGSRDKRIRVWNLFDSTSYGEFDGKDIKSAVLSVVVTPDSKYVLSICNDSKNIDVWRMEDMKFSHQLDHESFITSLAVTHDNKYVVAGSKDNTIGLWDFKENKCYHQFKGVHSVSVTSVVVTLDNKYVISAMSKSVVSVQEENVSSLEIWNIETKSLHHRFEEAHSDMINSVTTPDQDFVVSASSDKTIAVWSILEKRLLYRLEQAHSLEITSAVVTSDKQLLISGSEDRTISFWDFAKQTLLYQFESAHFKGIKSLAITSDDNYIVAGSKDKTIGIWRITEKKFFHEFIRPHPSPSPVAVTPDSNYIVSEFGNNSLGIWDIQTKSFFGKFEKVHKQMITSVTITPDQQYIISGSLDKRICVWDIRQKNLKSQAERAHFGQVKSLVVTPNNKYIVSSSSDKTIAIWDLPINLNQQLQLHHRFERAHHSEIESVAITPDSKYIVSGSWDRTLGLWDIKQKKFLHRFNGAHSAKINSVAVTPDQNHFYVASGSDDGSIGIWKLEEINSESRFEREIEIKLFHRFKGGHTGRVTSVTATSDSQYIVSVSIDQSILVWDILDWKLLLRLEAAHDEWIHTVTVTKNIKYIISGSSASIKVWNFESRAYVNQDLKYYPHLSHIYQELCPGSKDESYQPESESSAITQLSKLQCLPQRWNALNFIVFLLPSSGNQKFLDVMIKNKCYFSIDNYGKIQLEHLLMYYGEKNAKTDQFIAYFFKNTSALLNLKSSKKNSIVCSISNLARQVLESYGEMAFLDVFSSLSSKNVQEFLDNGPILPYSGELKNANSKDFIAFNNCVVKQKDIVLTVDKANGTDSFEYSLILYDCSYAIADESTQKLLRTFSSIESPGLLSPAIKNIIDLLWKRNKKLIWMKNILYFIPVGLFISFSLTKTLAEDASSILLILLDVFMGVLFIFELLQFTSDPHGYFKDPWNFIDMLLIILTVIISSLFWTHSNVDALSFFVSFASILFMTKALLACRVVDQLRNLIRLIIEVIKDMTSFLVVIASYTVAFAIAFFQKRRADEINASNSADIDTDGNPPDYTIDNGSFGNDLMEMFYLIFTGGTPSYYQGVAIPFYVIVTILQCLILINLIISIMGNTFSKLNDNFELINLREKINMLLELADESHIIMKKLKLITKKKTNSYLENPNKESLAGMFFLVIEKFEVINESDDLSERIAAMKSEVGILERNIFREMSLMKEELNSMKRAVGIMESRLASDMMTMAGEIKSDMNGKMRSDIIGLRAAIQDVLTAVTQK